MSEHSTIHPDRRHPARLADRLARLRDRVLTGSPRLVAIRPAAVDSPSRHARRTAALVCGLAVLPGLLASSPARAATSEPAWRIESFCRRPVAAEHRCLIRARQGIVVFRIAELPRAPSTTQWRDGVALLAWRSGQNTQWRYYRPPQQLSPTFDNVLAADPGRHRLAYRQGMTLRVADMFSGAPLAHWTLPDDLRAGSLQLDLRGPQPRVSWRDHANRAQTQTL